MTAPTTPTTTRRHGWDQRQGGRILRRYRGGWWRCGRGPWVEIGETSTPLYQLDMSRRDYPDDTPEGWARHLGTTRGHSWANREVLAGLLDAFAEYDAEQAAGHRGES